MRRHIEHPEDGGPPTCCRDWRGEYRECGRHKRERLEPEFDERARDAYWRAHGPDMPDSRPRQPNRFDLVEEDIEWRW